MSGLLLLAISRALENSLGTPHFLFLRSKEHAKLGYSVKSRVREKILSSIKGILEFQKSLENLLRIYEERGWRGNLGGARGRDVGKIVDFRGFLREVDRGDFGSVWDRVKNVRGMFGGQHVGGIVCFCIECV